MLIFASRSIDVYSMTVRFGAKEKVVAETEISLTEHLMRIGHENCLKLFETVFSNLFRVANSFG